MAEDSNKQQATSNKAAAKSKTQSIRQAQLKKVKRKKVSSESIKSGLGSVWRAVRSFVNAKWLQIISFAKKTKRFVVNIPGWVQSRPRAFKDWRAADKKKKKYRSFHLQKKIKPEPRYVPPVGQLLKQAFKTYFKNFWVFTCIMVVHAILYYLFVRGASSFDLKQVQETIRIILGENSGAAGTFTLLGSVLGSSQQREGGGPGKRINYYLHKSCQYLGTQKNLCRHPF